MADRLAPAVNRGCELPAASAGQTVSSCTNTGDPNGFFCLYAGSPATVLQVQEHGDHDTG